MDNRFEVRERPFEHGLILELSGDMTRLSEESLLRLNVWEGAESWSGRYLVLNFTQVPYMNSAGIALLIRLVRTGMKQGCQTFGFGLTPHFQKLFRMVGLTEYMLLYPDEYSVCQRIDDLERAER